MTTKTTNCANTPTGDPSPKMGRSKKSMAKSRPISKVFRLSNHENGLLQKLIDKNFKEGGRGELSEIVRDLIIRASDNL